jgi:beta-ribofuranosylaminobenzene 5'-phosphate synthase
VIRIQAPSRLHFGLLNIGSKEERWPDPEGNPGLLMRRFGGVGLMIDAPGVCVEVEPNSPWSASGIHAKRAVAFGQTFVKTLPPEVQQPFRIRVLQSPQEHIGLGVGTSLALSVAKAISVNLGLDWSSQELAKRVGRGERSAIGIHGFDRGGLIIDAGKLPQEVIAPMIGHFVFPKDWRILLIHPRESGTWHGIKEQQAFTHLNSNPQMTETLSRIILLHLIPACLAKDILGISEAIFEINYRVGQMFSSIQQGPYSSSKGQRIIESLRQNGIPGVGQSSWGPTIFALFPNVEETIRVQRLMESHFSDMAFTSTSVSSGCEVH